MYVALHALQGLFCLFLSSFAWHRLLDVFSVSLLGLASLSRLLCSVSFDLLAVVFPVALRCLLRFVTFSLLLRLVCCALLRLLCLSSFSRFLCFASCVASLVLCGSFLGCFGGA